MSHHNKTKSDWIVYTEVRIRPEGMIFFWFPCVVFFRFYSVLNLPRHNSEHKLSLIWTSFLFFSFFGCFFRFFCCWFFLEGGMFFFKSALFSQWQNIENGFKKGRKFPCRQYMCRFALKYLTYPFFLNVRQTGFLYLLICIYVIFKMLDSLYEKNMKKY